MTNGQRAEAEQIRERIAAHPYGPVTMGWVYTLDLDGLVWVLRLGDPNTDLHCEWRFPRFASAEWFAEGLSEAAEEYLATLRAGCHTDRRPEA